MLTNKGSIFDLATVYIMFYKDKYPYKTLLNYFKYTLDNGFTWKDCLKFIATTSDFSYFKNRSPQYGTNIIKQNVMYYHKNLRVQPDPSVSDVDYNNGTIVSTEQEHFTEIVASYTLDEVFDYFTSLDLYDTRQWQKSRVYNMLKYYVNKYGIDQVLFMIEAILNTKNEEEYFDLNKIDNMAPIGQTYKQTAFDNCRSNNSDTIKPRERNRQYM